MSIEDVLRAGAEAWDPKNTENAALRAKVAELSKELEIVLGFLVELQQWGASNCRCSFNAHSLLEKMKRGVE